VNLVFAKKATSRSKAISGVFVLTITLDLASGCNHPATNDPSAIRHTIFIIKENRTFDTYFGGFPGADGATTGIASTGQLVDLSHMADSSTLNLCNNWNCALHAVDGGKMDRFDQPAGNLDAYSRLTEQDIPNYWAYAHRFVWRTDISALCMAPVFRIIFSRLLPRLEASLTMLTVPTWGEIAMVILPAPFLFWMSAAT
jgi:phospholipase C